MLIEEYPDIHRELQRISPSPGYLENKYIDYIVILGNGWQSETLNVWYIYLRKTPNCATQM